MRDEVLDIERGHRSSQHRKHIDYLATPGSTVGCDFSGTVVEVGSKCVKGYKAGDRIAGVTHGANANDLNSGCFAEYAVVKEGASWKVPDYLSSEEAATTGVGIITVSMALCQKLGLPFPGEGKSDEWVLIYGGSTATGSLAIQSAKLYVKTSAKAYLEKAETAS